MATPDGIALTENDRDRAEFGSRAGPTKTNVKLKSGVERLNTRPTDLVIL
jgi:hypothetical protein